MTKVHHSISHCNSREQEALIRLKNTIVALYKPLLIYCLGTGSSLHTTRNCFGLRRSSTLWSFSCDLLIVLPANADIPVAAIRELKQVCDTYEHIHLIEHDWDFVVQQLQTYSLFFCWLQYHATLLYEQDNASLKLPQPLNSIKQYALQAEQYYAHNPQYEQHTELRLSPLPVASAGSLAGDPAGT